MEIRRAPARAGLPDVTPVREPAFRILPDPGSRQTPVIPARPTGIATVRTTAHARHPRAVRELAAQSALLPIRASRALADSPYPAGLVRPPVTAASRRAPTAVVPCRVGPHIRARND
ncbi:hypothetical protein PV336_03080 [Streptomyces sp. MI02-2A]|uniref:hypothetical protein n=1 Tax=unclassified Streptomyces TaxID=2593676 RepID=UPI000E286EF7|nr:MULTISPECIES: hypothetical protein [unclassified Streptomyces]MDX3258220.1 hypothetical protein [Streptomyces sp. MI02-2A]REE58372.1 hypothetical protein BX257_0792 [Streptomyces sp. 3212.3]